MVAICLGDVGERNRGEHFNDVLRSGTADVVVAAHRFSARLRLWRSVIDLRRA
jgi:hypothetical protein